MNQIIQVQQFTKSELLSSFRSIVAEELERQRIRTLDESETWTTEQTAKYCKVSKVTIWDWTKKGILRKHRIGGRVIYKPQEVKAAVLKIETK